MLLVHNCGTPQIRSRILAQHRLSKTIKRTPHQPKRVYTQNENQGSHIARRTDKPRRPHYGAYIVKGTQFLTVNKMMHLRVERVV